MRRLLCCLLLLGLCLPGNVAWGANGQGDPDQTRLRTRLQDRITIDDAAQTRQQDRLRLQDQDRLLFPDCVNHWAQSQIANAYAWGLISGYPDGSFGPNRYVTGAEAVIIMDNFARCLTGLNISQPPGAVIDWNNVPVWARARLEETTAQQIALQSQFYGDQQVNRLQVATALAKMLGLDPIIPAAGQIVFQDQANIPADQLGYLLALKDAGVITGYNGYFDPQGPITRAQIMTMLMQVLNDLE